MQTRKGFTTMVDLEEFEKTTWAYLTNVKMKWQYDGMAYAFREAGIPLYGLDQGTMKMNHPVLTMGVPSSKDKNYGVSIYVPVERKKKALKLISDEEKIKEYALLEEEHGDVFHKQFNSEARESKKRYSRTLAERRRQTIRRLLSRLNPSLA